MTYNDLTPANKRRFQGARCIGCLQPVSCLDNFETLEMKYKRIKIVAFVHQECIYKAAKAQMSSLYGKMEGTENGEGEKAKREQSKESIVKEN